MKRTIVETSVARLTYERSDGIHPTTPGDFRVFDKIREEDFWFESCYDGSEGFRNKPEKDVHNKGMEQFLLLNKKCQKLLTAEDQTLLDEIQKPVMVKAKNPKYWRD